MTIRFLLKSILRSAAWPLAALLAMGCAAPSAPTLRLMTYNIHHGEGTDGRMDLPRLAAVIRSVDPDAVALQEVDCRTGRSGGVDQATELARLTGMRAYFSAAMDYDGGQYGDAVLTRLPLAGDPVRLALPCSPGHEPRTVMAVPLQVSDKKANAIWFLSTHLDHTRDETDRLAQAAEIVKAFGPNSDYASDVVFLAGDLNAQPDSQTMRRIGQAWTGVGDNPPTFPADEPTIAIDYILVRSGKESDTRGLWSLKEQRVLDEAIASDHRPLLCVFEKSPTN